MKLCLACFRKCEDSAISCPHCGYGTDSFAHSSQALPIGTILCGRIATGKAEIKDKNTIAYFAFDKQTQKPFRLVLCTWPASTPSGVETCHHGNCFPHLNKGPVDRLGAGLEGLGSEGWGRDPPWPGWQ